MSARDWTLFALAALLSAGLALWLTRAASAAVRARMRAWARHTLRDFQARIARYKLVSRRAIHDELILDPVVVDAMRRHMKQHRLTELDVRVKVEQYIDEILPFFNVLSYYKLGYNLARLTLNLLYKVSIEYEDARSLDAIPRKDVVVYLMNHRSNADYVVVAYVLARGVAISYAVGEWARVWPLEAVFKSFGSYFIRRGYREPLYHALLERYIQLITRNGVTQGIFIEGGLSRDGRFRAAKIGLLDYIAGTLKEPGFDRDIWLVPVAINYDRTLEDRTLIRECLDPELREGRARQLLTVARYVGYNTLRLLSGRLKRYGRAAVNFGQPLSLRRWLSNQRPDLLTLPQEGRLPHVQRLADEALDRIKDIIPVTSVALAAAALLSFERDSISLGELLGRMADYRDHLVEVTAKVIRADREIEETWERALIMFRMRHAVWVEHARVVIVSRQRPLLEYYANSIRHLVPAGTLPEGQLFSPAAQAPAIETKYRLRPAGGETGLGIGGRGSELDCGMTLPMDLRRSREFEERSEAMAEFLRAAGEAPRLLPADDGLGCPLFNALAALQWTGETGLVQPGDRLHAVWFLGETGATVIEREIEGKPTFRYLGPRVETQQKTPADGAMSLDQPFVRGWDFAERWHALAHFFVTTHGKGALVSMLSTRAPEIEHIRRWLTDLFQGSLPPGADHLHALWATPIGAGFLFPPARYADGRQRGWTYLELGMTRED